MLEIINLLVFKYRMMKSDFYLEFENKFRGNRENVINKLSIYDSLIDLFIKKNTDITLLDIGCGRGEWLERWHEKIPNAIGIEQDQNMINLCESFGLNIMKGDAIEILCSLESASISLITIFHMIEHIESHKLTLLLEQCHRVLKADGILIMETPSIDNLLVSSKLFYIDSTHINHINPDRIIFDLECAGFSKANYYYINGGPLQNAASLKLTRVLNGVAQDLSIIACKSHVISDYIFNINLDWENNLSQAPTTLEAATNFDCGLESSLTEQNNLIQDQNKLINILHQEIILFKEKLSLLETNQLIINKVLSPLIDILRYLKRLIVYVCTSIFTFMLNYRLTRSILNHKYTLFLIRVAFKFFPFNLLNASQEKVYEAINKVKQVDIQSVQFNKKLTMHYNNSISAQEMRNILIKRIFRK